MKNSVYTIATVLTTFTIVLALATSPILNAEENTDAELVPLPGGVMVNMAKRMLALNQALQDIEAAAGSPEPKDEFESTETYLQRIEEHDNRIVEAQRVASSGLDNIWFDATYQAVLEDYDADKGCFPSAVAKPWIGRLNTTERPSPSYDHQNFMGDDWWGILGSKRQVQFEKIYSDTVRSAVFDNTYHRLVVRSHPICLQAEQARQLKNTAEADGIVVKVWFNRFHDTADKYGVKGRFRWRLKGEFYVNGELLPIDPDDIQ